jgi:hypothetical protein
VEHEHPFHGHVAPLFTSQKLTDFSGNLHLKNYETFQLILEFKDTSFNEGERQVLTHLSKLLNTQSLSDVTFVVKFHCVTKWAECSLNGKDVMSDDD